VAARQVGFTSRFERLTDELGVPSLAPLMLFEEEGVRRHGAKRSRRTRGSRVTDNSRFRRK
jgi:hypothetical protein